MTAFNKWYVWLGLLLILIAFRIYAISLSESGEIFTKEVVSEEEYNKKCLPLKNPSEENYECFKYRVKHHKD